MLQFRSNFSLDRVCLLRQPVGGGRVRGEPQKCERLLERRRGCWRRFIQPTERTATLEPRRAAPFHYLQGLEKTNHATLRSAKEKELQPQVPSRKFSISRRKNVFHS